MSEYSKIENKYSTEKQTELWNLAVGLQRVDNLKPSEYLKELAADNVAGRLSNAQIEELLYGYYEHETLQMKAERTKECDIVSNRIVELLQTDGAGIVLNPAALKSIHHFLFQGIYDHAGNFRKFNISKAEPILNGRSVKYANYFMLQETLEYDMTEEKSKPYDFGNMKAVITRIAKFTSAIWQVHPFAEGNTRTTAVFMERYLNSMGFQVNNELFKEYATYFRNALVRSNYADFANGINSTNQYLEGFYENLLLQGKNLLQSRDLVLQDLFPEPER